MKLIKFSLFVVSAVTSLSFFGADAFANTVKSNIVLHYCPKPAKVKSAASSLQRVEIQEHGENKSYWIVSNSQQLNKDNWVIYVGPFENKIKSTDDLIIQFGQHKLLEIQQSNTKHPVLESETEKFVCDYPINETLHAKVYLNS